MQQAARLRVVQHSCSVLLNAWQQWRSRLQMQFGTVTLQVPFLVRMAMQWLKTRVSVKVLRDFARYDYHELKVWLYPHNGTWICRVLWAAVCHIAVYKIEY